MNVVVRYHGAGQRKPLLLLAHLDVVEAKPSDWSMDPFKLNEKDGYFYGRGTIDDKAQASIWIANLIRYKREGFQAGSRHHRRAHRRRRRRRTVQRREPGWSRIIATSSTPSSRSMKAAGATWRTASR